MGPTHPQILHSLLITRLSTSSTRSLALDAKVHELELRTIALAANLSKTVALYKDCFARLQKAEAQCVEQKKEYEYVLSILSKVDDDRIQLQQKCRVLVGGTERDQLKSLKHLDRIVEHPEVEVVEVRSQTHARSPNEALYAN
eukprot:Gb_30854 [translate_table: standard]